MTIDIKVQGTSNKRSLWPWLFGAVFLFSVAELLILSSGARVLIWSMPPVDLLIEGRDCWYFTGKWIEGPFDALESCPFFAPDRRAS